MAMMARRTLLGPGVKEDPPVHPVSSLIPATTHTIRGIDTMRRDLNAMRQILLALESSRPLDGLTPDEIGHHTALLEKAGLIDPSPVGDSYSLSWSGSEFVELARDEAIWTSVLTIVQNRVGGTPFSIVKETLFRRASAKVASADD
jgi:Hypothetical protein (DUF2513)